MADVVNEKLLALSPVIEAPKFTVNCIVFAFEYALPAVMELMVVGAAGCTVLNVVDAPGAGAKFPAMSLAVPGAIEMPNVPAPVMFEIVTVYEVPDPDNPKVPLALPVVLSVIFERLKVLVLKFASA